jgi:Methylmalonic aciduria and homocystinuria type D protein
MAGPAPAEAAPATHARPATHTRPAPLLGVCASRRREYGVLEYSVHTASTGTLRRDAGAAFPSADSSALLLVAVLQRAAMPLTAFGDAEAAEKDRLQAVFFRWAGALRDQLAANGHWADATDPATGVALFGDAAAAYSDVPPIARALRYPTRDEGGCRILLHPEWRAAVYPSSFFSTAPLEALQAALEEVNAPEPPCAGYGHLF